MLGNIRTHFISLAAILMLAGTAAHAGEKDKVYLEGEGVITVDESQEGKQSEAGTSETPLPEDERDDVDEDARTAGEEE